MVDPISRTLTLAPVDEEAFTGEDRRAVAEAEEWRKHNQPIPLEQVLADVGLTMSDWATMSRTLLPEADGRRNG